MDCHAPEGHFADKTQRDSKMESKPARSRTSLAALAVVARSIQQNALLAALPAAARERLAPNLKLMDMPLGKVLGRRVHAEPGDRAERRPRPLAAGPGWRSCPASVTRW